MPSAPPSAPAKFGSAEPKRGRVLVIDDERSVRELFVRVLRIAGFDVVAASGGDEGLRILRTDPSICLVLLDLTMPEVDGVKVRQAQRADARLAAITTIVVSGAPLSGIVHDELLAADYLLKPVGQEHLLSVVGRYCRPEPPPS